MPIGCIATAGSLKGGEIRGRAAKRGRWEWATAGRVADVTAACV